MTKEDVKIMVMSAAGKNTYIEAMVSRTVARKVERLLEQEGVVMSAPYNEKKAKREECV